MVLIIVPYVILMISEIISLKNPSLPRPGMARISFGLYNTRHEVDILINLLEKVSRNKKYYMQKYASNN